MMVFFLESLSLVSDAGAIDACLDLIAAQINNGLLSLFLFVYPMRFFTFDVCFSHLHHKSHSIPHGICFKWWCLKGYQVCS